MVLYQTIMALCYTFNGFIPTFMALCYIQFIVGFMLTLYNSLLALC